MVSILYFIKYKYTTERGLVLPPTVRIRNTNLTLRICFFTKRFSLRYFTKSMVDLPP